MRKNILTLGLVATAFVASQSAYASRARNAVLGSADPFNVFTNAGHGSLYVNDAYNMFYSPAKINDNKNFFTMEKSNGEAVGNKLAASNTNDAEGGFVTSMGDFTFGAFLNRTTGVQGNFSDAASALNPLGNNNFRGELRPIELMFGGDVGVKYGLGYTYANGGDKTGANTVTRARSHNVRAGIEYMGAELFGDVNLASKQMYGSKSALTPNDQEVKNNNMGIGGRYTYGEWIAYAGYRSVKSEAPTTLVSANASNITSKTTNYAVGVGRNAKLSDSTSLNYAVGYHRQIGTTKPKAGNEAKVRTVMMPLDVSLESELASWFIARGGMQYRLAHRGTTNGIEAPVTNGSLGGTFRFGKVDVDFAMSTANNGAAVTGDPALTGANLGFSDNLFSYVSMTYCW